MDEVKQEIDGVVLYKTCNACPEQYDAIDPRGGATLGYLRLRHGAFTVECPDVGGSLVYAAHPQGSGAFTDEERDMYLQYAVDAIKKYHGMGPVPPSTYAVAMLRYDSSTIEMQQVRANSELEAALQVAQLDDKHVLFSNLEELQEYFHDQDQYISVLKV